MRFITPTVVASALLASARSAVESNPDVDLTWPEIHTPPSKAVKFDLEEVVDDISGSKSRAPQDNNPKFKEPYSVDPEVAPPALGVARHAKNPTFNDKKNIIVKLTQRVPRKLYTGTVFVGKNSTGFRVTFDTGSNDFLLVSTLCTPGNENCESHKRRYDPTESGNRVTGLAPMNITYGRYKGYTADFWTDKVAVGGLVVQQQRIAAATSMPLLLHKFFFPADGVAGLGFAAQHSFFHSIRNTGEELLPIFTFDIQMRRASRLIFGSYSTRMLPGRMATAPVLTMTDKWMIEMGDIVVGETRIPLGANRTALIDSGSTFITGPPDLVRQLHQAMDVNAILGEDGNWELPCNLAKTTRTVSFTIGGVQLPMSRFALQQLSPHEAQLAFGKCYSTILPIQDQDYWGLGIPFFLSNVITFDGGDMPKIGFISKAKL